MVFIATFIVLGTYFHKKRSRAISISMLGDGIGGLVLAPLLTSMFDYYGYPGAMIILAGLALQCTVIGALYRPLIIAAPGDIGECNDSKGESKIYQPQVSNGHYSMTKQSDDLNGDDPHILGIQLRDIQYIDAEAEHHVTEEKIVVEEDISGDSNSYDTAYNSQETLDSGENGRKSVICSDNIDNDNELDIKELIVKDLEHRTARLSKKGIIKDVTDPDDISKLLVTTGNGNEGKNNSSRNDNFKVTFLKYVDIQLLTEVDFMFMALMCGCVAISNSMGNMYLAGHAISRGFSKFQVSTLMSTRAGTFLAAKLLSGVFFDSSFVRHRKAKAYGLLSFIGAFFVIAVPLTSHIVSVYVVWIFNSFILCWLITQEAGVVCDIVTIHRFPSALGITRFVRGIMAFAGSLITGKF